MRKLTKSEMEEALQTMPDKAIFGASHAGLTGKQKAFARKVAMGKSKAQAYRETYNVKSHNTIVSAPYELANNPKVAREIEALEVAQRAAAYRTPAKLREFVIQTLLEVALDPDTKAAVRVQAVKTLGTVTEVAAFTERKEVLTHHSSTAARDAVLQELRTLLTQSDDVQDIEAKTLLQELESASTSGNSTYQNPESGNVATQNDNNPSPGQSSGQDT